MFGGASLGSHLRDDMSKQFEQDTILRQFIDKKKIQKEPLVW